LFREPGGNLDIELLAETELDRLLDRKAVVYTNLRDLEFEFKMGRLSAADFQQLEAGYKNDAAVILERLDRLNASENLDESIERDIASHKTKRFAPVSKGTQATLRCPQCGAEVLAGKKYCSDCGQRI
jgi:hypothetical protein